jgi:hypothetical protein
MICIISALPQYDSQRLLHYSNRKNLLATSGVKESPPAAFSPFATQINLLRSIIVLKLMARTFYQPCQLYLLLPEL